ncbi:MAG: hypothetical protein JST00_26460 [Deltaproteobacteria bacterium]|nr:hypothetical protein [Deltaproteobacteria bacterium]
MGIGKGTRWVSGYAGVQAAGGKQQRRKFSAEVDGIYAGVWHTAKEAAVARDRLVLHLGADYPLHFPARSRKLGAASAADLIFEARAREKELRNASHFFGVSFDTSRNRGFICTVCIGDKKSVDVAVFEGERDAALAYDHAVLGLGLTKHLNFPELDLVPLSIEEIRIEARRIRKRQMQSIYERIFRDPTGRWYASVGAGSARVRRGPFSNERDAARVADELYLALEDSLTQRRSRWLNFDPVTGEDLAARPVRIGETRAARSKPRRR